MPYEQIFVSYTPVFIWSLGLPWRLFQEAAALQLLMATYALMGVVAIVYLGLSYRSFLAGITAALFLSFTPDYFAPSIAVMGEVQSVGVAILAIALAEKSQRFISRIMQIVDGFKFILMLASPVKYPIHHFLCREAPRLRAALRFALRSG